MFATDSTHRRVLAAVLAFAVPAFLLAACNDDPLFEVPVEPPAAPTAVSASAVGNDVTVAWTPGVGATSQEVRLSPVVAVPLSAGNALQANDIVQVIEDGTTDTWTFTSVPDGAYEASVTAINSGGRTTSAADAVVVGGDNAPTITSFMAVDDALVVEWTAVSTAEAYHVTLTETDGGAVVEEIEDLSTSPTSYTFTAAPTAGVTYTAEVCAVFDLGQTEDCGATVDYTYVVNTAPTAEITAPANASVFFDTELITFTGTGTDAEDGNLTGGLLDWSSDVDGALGEGEELVADASTVTLGAHVITLTATDTQGATGEDGILIEIVEATSAISFASTVQTYFVDTGCTSCHGGASPVGGIALDTWEGIARGENSNGDPLIAIGDATMGVLIPQMQTDHAGGPAPTGTIDDTSTWVNDGAPNN